MALPPDIVEAQAKMKNANDALRADLDSKSPANSERRSKLIDELKRATDDYIVRISRLGRK